jgi:hypothetical protein
VFLYIFNYILSEFITSIHSSYEYKLKILKNDTKSCTNKNNIKLCEGEINTLKENIKINKSKFDNFFN